MAINHLAAQAPSSKLPFGLVTLQPFAMEPQVVALRAGLQAEQKHISPFWIYDDNGSDLFQQITQLPDYYLTRTEARLLQTQGHQIADWFTAQPDTLIRIIELGAGDGTKGSLIIDAMKERGQSVSYVPVDISTTALQQAGSWIAKNHPEIECIPLLGDFFDGLHYTQQLPAAQQLILFLGSNIGNFEATAIAPFLRQLAQFMRPNDALLVGFDLVKDHRQLLAAYDDPQGLTAEFNRNALRHLNTRFDANFDLTAFVHCAYYDPSQEAMKSYLISTQAQTVELRGLNLSIDLQPHEAIYMEHAQKFTRKRIVSDAHAAGLSIDLEVIDKDGYFAEIGFVLT